MGDCQIRILAVDVTEYHILYCFVLASVQKLSEFFSCDEIGSEQEPRATILLNSTNHNKYQALVSQGSSL